MLVWATYPGKGKIEREVNLHHAEPVSVELRFP